MYIEVNTKNIFKDKTRNKVMKNKASESITYELWINLRKIYSRPVTYNPPPRERPSNKADRLFVSE